MIKHQIAQRCDSNTQIRWWGRDVMIASRCAEDSFSLVVEYKAECIVGVNIFKYLGLMLNRSDYGWPVVVRNVGKARQFWRWLGKLTSREGAYPRVSAMFYHSVVQAVLLLGAETWVLSASMSQKL